MRPGVCVGILTYNEEKNIARCLDSLSLGEGIDFPWEIIVVDNGSTDCTLKIVSTFVPAFSSLGVSLKILRSQRNNLGLARAMIVDSTDYAAIAFLDADCQAPPHWLACLNRKLQENLEQDPNLAAVGGANIPPLSTNRFYSAQHLLFRTFLGNLGSPQATTFKRDRYVYHLSTCNVIYRRRPLLEAGNFSPDFSTVCEDVDISYRLQALGYSLLFASDSSVVHHVTPTFFAWGKKIFKYGYGNAKIMFSYRQHRTFRLVLPLIFAGFWIALVFWRPNLTLPALCLYLFAIFILSMSATLRRESIHVAFTLWGLFALTHFSYSIGELVGINYFLLCRLKRISQ